ncbi:hypothetical protein OPV22_010741 [Ensete ventricosum]|uniref:Uncharacterized protein n=1 Tax=Ensete ventricosum TaxID=4639 RepID=A0AAV8RJS9_ENSVE|nr:hypothetical protein OPV22_010741 [Ensete ventricosum]
MSSLYHNVMRPTISRCQITSIAMTCDKHSVVAQRSASAYGFIQRMPSFMVVKIHVHVAPVPVDSDTAVMTGATSSKVETEANKLGIVGRRRGPGPKACCLTVLSKNVLNVSEIWLAKAQIPEVLGGSAP